MHRLRAAVIQLFHDAPQETPTARGSTVSIPAMSLGSATPTTPATTASPPPPSVPRAYTSQTRRGSACGPGTPAGHGHSRTVILSYCAPAGMTATPSQSHAGRRRRAVGSSSSRKVSRRESRLRSCRMVLSAREALSVSTLPCLTPTTVASITSVSME